MVIYVFLAIAGVVCFSIAISADDLEGRKGVFATDSLACALNEYTISIPDVEIFDVNAALNLRVTNIQCSEFRVTSAPSLFLPPASLRLQVQGASLACFATVRLGYLSDRLALRVSTDFSLSVAVESEGIFPASFNVTQCSENWDVRMDFGGLLLDPLRPLVASAIEGTIQRQHLVCGEGTYSRSRLFLF
ncbi:hypothetical protein EON64_20955 [archaeon]|nr:MAG: hypothetical protein EON64_20955 [archaeon]